MDESQLKRSARMAVVIRETRKLDEQGEGKEGKSSSQADEERQMQKEEEKQRYNAYVKEMTPTKNLWWQMCKAFLVGGVICIIGQGILNYCEAAGLDKVTSGSWCSLLLVLLSVLLTGLSLYQYIAAWGGAGALVPITGFANSVAAPAIEYKTEGQVYGIGVKIFTIAGPVILYGVFTSWILGLIYWIGTCMGIV